MENGRVTSNKKLSIIVPVYNVEKYLKDCLDSLLDQNFPYTDYEIICVNDGSTDGSGDILDEYAERYENIVVINQENSGVSVARNKGLLVAKGKYIYFCDSDDIVLNILGDAVKVLEEIGGESCSFKFKQVDEDFHYQPTGSRQISFLTEKNKIFYSGNIWQFIFLRSILIDNNVFFKDIQYGEDELFIWNVCLKLNFKKHIYIENRGYLYRQREGSLLHQNKEKKYKIHYKCMIRMALEYKQMLQENNISKQVKKETKHRYSYAVTNALYDAICIGEGAKSVIKELKSLDIYPFPFYWRLLRPKKSIKSMCSNWIKFFFPIKPYYFICSKILRKK